MTVGPDWVFVGLGGNIGTQAEILARFEDACARLAVWAEVERTS